MPIISASGLASNVGLLDARAMGRKFHSLRQSFLPVDFFDMCSIIEEICLREKIFLVAKWQKVPPEYRAELQPFINEKVFELALEPRSLPKVDSSNSVILSAASAVHKKSLTSATTAEALSL